MVSWPNKFTLEQIKRQWAYVWSFGQNSKGELSVGHYNDVMMPERVRGLPKMKILFVSSGGKHTGAVTEDGKLWMCGSNLHDKLGLEGITVGSKKTFK
jgi:alpha-tubulin suppressor-like RCC1 family protein